MNITTKSTALTVTELREQVLVLMSHVEWLIGLANALGEDDGFYFDRRNGGKIIREAQDALTDARRVVDKETK